MKLFNFKKRSIEANQNITDDLLLKSILSENTIKGVKISKGNKIQLLDMSGNLYEGVLTLKRKAK